MAEREIRSGIVATCLALMVGAGGGPAAPVGGGIGEGAQALVSAPECPPGYNVIVGTARDDVLVGTKGADCIVGRGGNDRLVGKNGDDLLIGGDGDDTLEGGNGDDKLVGGPGNDTLKGGNGDDVIEGGDGDDFIAGGNGDDRISGEGGADRIRGGRGADTISGGDGDDAIHSGRAGADTVEGGAGNDLIRVEGSGNTVLGGPGNDVIATAGNGNTVDGGPGRDSCVRGCEIVEPLKRCRVGHDDRNNRGDGDGDDDDGDYDDDDGDPCGAESTCEPTTRITIRCHADGQCASGSAGTCRTRECQPSAGCFSADAPNGTACSDGNACTRSDTCQAGVCRAGPALTCTASDSCHLPGTCNPSTGACSNPVRPNGASCSDGDACTRSDTCQAGVCRGADPVVCAGTDPCSAAGTCNPSTGLCSTAAQPDGTACNDSNACTRRDVCLAGTCRGDDPIDCADANPCTADSCDRTRGCSYTPVPNGPFEGSAVTTCGVGACAARGMTVCANGAVADTCVPGVPAARDATCDGVDDDCSGAADEDFTPVVTRCGVGACARTGETSCAGGIVSDSCVPGTPAENDATCDGIDDDCDGRTDEDYTPAATTCGTGACLAGGTTACNAGRVVIDCTPAAPISERDATCDGVDDDCDGNADDDYPATPTTCGVGACAATGTHSCVNGAPVDSCNPGTPAVLDTTCDGVDDDCDGVADEDYLVRATTCGTGPCAVTVASSCVGGMVDAPVCAPRVDGPQCRLLPGMRPGRPKAWEDTLMWRSEGAMAVSPNGNLLQRISLFSWQPPGVGPPIEVVLHHNSADATRQRGFGLGFRLGATLSVGTDGAVTVEEEDGTPRTFTPDGQGGFASEVFDIGVLRRDGASYVLRSPGGLERIFRDANGLGFVERTRRDRLGDEVSFVYDAENRLARIQDSVGRATVFTRSGERYTSATDAEGRVLDFTHDDAGRLIRVEGPEVGGARATVVLTYAGATGRIRSRTSLGQAATTVFDYDNQGRLTLFLLEPSGLGTRIDYTDGQVALTDSSRRVFVQKFAYGKVIASITPDGLATGYSRDPRGRTVMTVDAYGRRSQLAYNAGDDVVSYRDEAGRTSTFTYDDRHNALTATDPYGDTTRYTYNALDQVTTVTNPLEETTEYRYDAAGNLRSVVDFTGVTRLSATYNAFGRPLTLTGADGLTTTRTYDTFGNLASLAVPGLPTIQRTASPLDRTLSYVDLWGEERSFGYDGLGRVTGTPYGPGSERVEQDLEGRVTAAQTTVGTHTERSEATYNSYGPTSLSVNGVTIEASSRTFGGRPVLPAAACTPACALRCGTRIGDTCGGLIDCACASTLSCNAAGFCVP